jgi:ATP-dependent helicase/nuclease subunit A
MDMARARAVAAAEDEYRRLLYVAMTRAADRLVVCGAIGVQRQPEGCWYDLVAQALIGHCTEEGADDGAGSVWRYRKGPGEPAPARSGATADEAEERSRAPSWLLQDVKLEPARPAALSPSNAYDEKVLVRSTTGVDRNLALKRGEAMHRLLQSLPDLAAETRALAAERHLARLAEFSEEERAAMVAQVSAVLGDARFAVLFGPGSRAEVPIVGRVAVGGETHEVNGQVDRLVVTPDAVLIADFKTGGNRGDRFEDYARQLALYRAVLRSIYPARPVRAALVWTETPELAELSAGQLDAALATVTPA